MSKILVCSNILTPPQQTKKKKKKKKKTIHNFFKKNFSFHIDITTKVGQMQLIRRSIANELNFSCKLDSYVLHSALEAFNTALIGDIRAHYRSPATNPYPSDDNPLLPEISTYLETSGISHPFTKIYITTEPLDSLPLVLFLFTLSQMPKLEYQPALGTMWCKVKNDPLDEAPLVVGIITILKQFHFSVTQTYVSYAGQYIRGSVNFASTSKETSKNHDFPPEVVNLLHFLEDFCRLSHTSRKVVEAHVPSYIFDQYQSR
jgi:WASH complex subunit strumpellin